MRSKLVACVTACLLVVAFNSTGYAQEAFLTGTVTDLTGGVLPGATAVAVHEATGNTFETVTDGFGVYSIPARVGLFAITIQMPGFQTVTLTGVTLQVGQEGVVDFELSPSGLEETVTVTGEAPLLDTTSSRISGNIDTRQLQELPLNGRNWMDLTMLAPGSRMNAVGELPHTGGRGLQFQLNIDGQEVTQMIATGFGQPRFSRDAIAEFEFISNRFDATQGRSSGVQVNAITKSGTNAMAGTFSGYFRDDSLNAEDHIQKRVLPYSNQQVSVTFGGPIRLDRIHFFGNYEYEREPATFAYDTPYPSFNIDQSGPRTLNTGGARLDFQFTSRTRLTVRGTKYKGFLPFDPRFAGGGTAHPAQAHSVERQSNHLIGTLSQVVSNRSVNEIKVGYAGFFWDQKSAVSWPNHPQAPLIVNGAPIIRLNGFNIGQRHSNTPQFIGDDPYSIRDNFTTSFNAGGRHNLQVGGEYIYMVDWLVFCNSCMGTIDARGGPIPDNIEELFPVWNDVSTWNLLPLNHLVRRYTVGVGNFRIINTRDSYATWFQDDWQVTPNLTLNLGVRYDLTDGTYAENTALEPFLQAGRPLDTNNVQPRLGFAYSASDMMVVRGGYGRFYGSVTGQPALWASAWSQQIHPEVLFDGRPDFIINPFNGPAPSFAELEAGLCDKKYVEGCVRRTIRTQLISPNATMPYSHQATVGFVRQLGENTAFDVDYVFTGQREQIDGRNINLTYDPATGANRPFTDISSLPFPDWGAVSMDFTDASSDLHSLQTAFRKRFSDGWQLAATYTLSGLWDERPLPILTYLGCEYPMTAPGVCDVPITLKSDMGGERTLSTSDQRHRAVVNGIWELGRGLQLSGLYFFGSGERYRTTAGGDRRRQGRGGESRLRADGTIVPRNDFVGNQLHRVDLRLQQRVSLGGQKSVDAIFEVFNVLNHKNYGRYVTVEGRRNSFDPSFNNNQAYQPRIAQIGFRIAF